jgi:hypothetical protein
MATAKVYIRVTVDGKRRYCPAGYTPNHKIRPEYALVDGKPQHFPGCSYFLRYSVGKRRVWQLVGDASAVPAALRDLQYRLAGGTLATIPSPPEPVADAVQTPSTSLAASISDYLAYIPANKSKKTAAAYLNNWREWLLSGAVHEFNHVNQFQNKLRLSEVACERKAADALERFRAAEAEQAA